MSAPATPARVLVVGDGDLAYSAALAAQRGASAVVYGTVLPSEEEQVRLYSQAVVAKKAAVLAKHGGRAVYGVDCTQAHTHAALGQGRAAELFDEAHFNFPHLGYSQQAERGGKWSRAQQHLDLFKGMFASLRKVQPTGGVVKLTLTPTPPYPVKEVKKVAIESGYVFTREDPFFFKDYPEYHPAWGDDRDLRKPGSSNYGDQGRQLVFTHCSCRVCDVVCKGEEQLEQHKASKKHALAAAKDAANKAKGVKGAAKAASPAERRKQTQKQLKRKDTKAQAKESAKTAAAAAGTEEGAEGSEGAEAVAKKASSGKGKGKGKAKAKTEATAAVDKDEEGASKAVAKKPSAKKAKGARPAKRLASEAEAAGSGGGDAAQAPPKKKARKAA
eukprot:Rhum_TRINITY_DN19075_c0_g1::Rhum_TRINITY_DN19075_c0_g1_i1::g.169186::m.169186/K19307/BMT5; 25S rRNA (uracil2634-N3)-methyltransferase